MVPLGVDTDLFAPATQPRIPGRVIAIASADRPLKGVGHLLHAVAKLRAEHDLELQLVAKLEPNGPTEKLIAELGISDIVHISQRTFRRRIGAAVRLRRDRLHPFALRRVFTAGRGSDGQRDTDRGQPCRRVARGARDRRRLRRAGAAGDAAELIRVLGELLDSPDKRRRLGAAGRRGPSRCSAGNPWRRRPYASTNRPSRGQAERPDQASGRVLTVDFDRLGIGPGTKVIDVGCGAGRHSFEAYRRGADVVAFDQNAAELRSVDTMLRAMAEAGEAPAIGSAQAVVGDALALPYPDETFDCVIASEILEHVPADDAVIAELIRVLKVGGTLAVTVPRWLPERVCWLLSDDYHSNEGGHIRIYRANELRGKIAGRGMKFTHTHHSHALHSPFWWLKCAVGVETRPSGGRRLPQDAGVGHDAAAPVDPAGRIDS